MASLLSKLEKGEVPAEVANLRFASLLLDNPKVVYGDVQGHPHHFFIGLGITSVKMGLGLDVSLAMAAHCKTAVQGMITWLRSASNDLKNGHANASTMLFTEMGELLDQGMCDRAERKLQFAPESHTVLLGSNEVLKRNAHAEPRILAATHNVDWSALLAEGGMRPFVASVITALYHEGNKTGIDRLMQCMFGTYYTGDIDNVESTAGAKGVYFGAFVHFQVIGHAKEGP